MAIDGGLCDAGEFGNGVHRDPEKAAELYRKAAEHGVVNAQLELAHLYQAGKGFQHDYFEAAKWYRRAAEQGHPVGENAIGVMYYRGEGVRRDYRQAAEWFLRAANQNCVLAQLNLGFLYQRGLGVPLDYAEAYKWFMLAAKEGEAESKRVLKELTQIMTKTQLRDGQSRVSDWTSQNSNATLAGQKADAKELNSDISARVP